MKKFERNLVENVIAGLENAPAVFINGPRQSGKSTLAKIIATKQQHTDYVSFDDLSILSTAKKDPVNFLQSFTNRIIIDEVQLAPELFRPLKKYIDELRPNNKANGKFILTGSTNIMILPELSDSLVGRMAIFTLYPLSAPELLGKQANFIDNAFNEKFKFKKIKTNNSDLETIIINSTFPEIASNTKINPEQWYANYLTTLLQRDVKALAEIEKISALPHMLKIMATRAGGLLNDAALARDSGLNNMTYRRYRILFESLFLTISVPPWSRHLGKRLVKAPKMYFTDTGLLCHLLGANIASLQKTDPELFGNVLENFIASELTKQLALKISYSLYHFRTQDNKEVDFVIEKNNGQLIGIEVKSRATVKSDDFAGLKTLQDLVGKDFIQGIVLYRGENIIPFGEKFVAMPINALWENI